VLAAGLLLVPQGIGSLLTRGPLGTLIDRAGPRPFVLIGTALTALGTLAFTRHGPEWLLAGSLVVRGAGMSGANIAVMAAAYRGLDAADIPHASSVTRILQQVGGSFGAAVLAVILQRQLAAHPAATAYAHVFWWSIGFAALAVVPALLLPGVRRERSAEVTAGT
jgi:MFS family permease